MNFIVINYKEILGFISVLIIIPQVYIYFRSIIIWETKPHIYTKIIWFILTWIGFLIQLQNWWWPGSWLLWITCFNQLIFLILSVKYWTPDITKFDTFLLISALICIPIYLWIEDKLYALSLVIFIDMLWYIPTIRKSYNDPYSENITAWTLWTIKYIISIFALYEFSFYTLAYPIFLIVFNWFLLIILLYRRKYLNLRKV